VSRYHCQLEKNLSKTDISFWHYLTDRLGIISEQPIAPLPDIFTARAALAKGY
jgi:hypothetical protein